MLLSGKPLLLPDSLLCIIFLEKLQLQISLFILLSIWFWIHFVSTYREILYFLHVCWQFNKTQKHTNTHQLHSKVHISLNNWINPSYDLSALHFYPQACKWNVVKMILNCTFLCLRCRSKVNLFWFWWENQNTYLALLN